MVSAASQSMHAPMEVYAKIVTLSIISKRRTIAQWVTMHFMVTPLLVGSTNRHVKRQIDGSQNRQKFRTRQC